MFVSVRHVEFNQQRIKGMKEHNLPEISKLYVEMATIQAKIKEAREMSPELSITYKVEPFEAETREGVKWMCDRVDAHALLDLTLDEIRVPVMNTIERCLYDKVDAIKLKLKKLGVRLEEPQPQPKPKEPLQLTGPKIRSVK